MIKNFDKAINPPPTTASTARTYTYTQEEYKDRSTVRVPTKMGTHYDSSYMLTDYDRYDNLTPFENQKTATFAKVQALANKNAYARQSLANEEGFEFPQCTERFGDITRIPYSVDQSQINDQSMFAGKSIDISLLKNARVSTVLNTDFKKKNPREDVSYSVIRNTGFDPNQSDSQINNLFEKHIVNIDKDIEDLAKIFHEKSLKERGFLALRMNTEAASEYDTDEENNDKAIVREISGLMLIFIAIL